MKPDYKNWMPKGMVLGTGCGAIVALINYIVFRFAPLLQVGTLKTVLTIVFLVLTIIGVSTLRIYGSTYKRVRGRNGKLFKGDVKMYNKPEILEFMEKAGFNKVKYRKISPFSFQCVAKK